MSLPVRPHPSAAPGTRRSRVLHDVAAANASSDPCLEFLPEARVFTIVPASSEPPRYVTHRRPQDVGLFRRSLRLLHPRTVLLALHRGVVGTLLALYRAVAGTLLALRRGVVGTLVALHRVVVGTLLALRRRVVETLSTLHRSAVGASVVARWTTSEVTLWTRSFCAAVIEGTSSLGISGLSRYRRFCGEVRTRGHAIWRHYDACTMLVRARLASDISTIERLMSMGGRRLAVVTRSLHERRRISIRALVRNAQKMAMAHQPPGMRIPLWAQKISRARVPVLNLTLAAFTAGFAVGALVIWQFGMQPGLPRPTGNSAALGPDVVASGTAVPGTATLYAVTSGTMPGEQQGTKPSPVSVPMVVMSAAVTVMSTPAGARVTVDGIGWGETPVTIRHLPPGQKVVRVTKEGYKSQQRIVNLADAPRPAAVRITLRAHD